MPIYRVGRFRFNSDFLISTEDEDEESGVAMRVTMFPGREYGLDRPEAEDFGRKLDGIEGEPGGPFVAGGVLASFDPQTGRPIANPGAKDVPGA